MSREVFKNPGLGEGDIAEVLKTLPRVEVPGDFEARVRGGIAAERQTKKRSWFVPATASAAVLVVAGVIAAVVLFGLGDRDTNTVVSEPHPTIDQPVPQEQFGPSNTENDLVQQAVPDQTPEPENTTAEEPSLVSNPRSPRQKREDRRKKESSDGGSSIRWTIKPAMTPIGPDGMRNPGALLANTNTANANVSAKARIPVKDVLELFGINAEFADGRWVVKRVSASGVAGLSGVEAGDVIESFGGRTLSGDTQFEDGRIDRTITVRRAGELKTVNLRGQ